jgi:hypothetical protein
MAVYSSSMYFVSAASSECFGNSSIGYVICAGTDKSPITGKESTFVIECSKDKQGTWNCQKIGAKVNPPGIDEAIKRAIMPQSLGKSTDAAVEDSTNIDCKKGYQQEGNKCVLNCSNYYANINSKCTDTWVGGTDKNSSNQFVGHNTTTNRLGNLNFTESKK